MSVRLTRASSQYLSRATPFDYNASYAVCGWFALQSVGIAQGVVGLRGDANNWDGVIIGTDNKLAYGTQKAGVTLGIATGATVLAAATPYVLALVRSGEVLSLYVGTSPATLALELTFTGSATVAGRLAAALLLIGQWVLLDNSADAAVGGWRAWTAALTLAQLKAEAAEAAAVLRTNLWGDWTLPDRDTLTDGSGNGRTLTAVNGPLTAAAAPPYLWPAALRRARRVLPMRFG